MLSSRISHRQLPEFDEVLKISAWNEEITMPTPEKKFIFIALPAGGNCESMCVQSVCDLDFPFCLEQKFWEAFSVALWYKFKCYIHSLSFAFCKCTQQDL